MVLALTFLSGCPPPRPDHIVDFSVLSKYVGQEVTIEGCLEFICPEHCSERAKGRSRRERCAK